MGSVGFWLGTGRMRQLRKEELHELVTKRLQRLDRRFTGGRRAIVELLIDAGHPVTIRDIGEMRPGLARSSVYRNLVDLEQAGVVRRIAVDDEFSRYELAEDLTEHHHHLLCVKCGKVIDMPSPAPLERELDQAVREVSKAEGFLVASHRVDVLGVCASCRSAGYR